MKLLFAIIFMVLSSSVIAKSIPDWMSPTLSNHSFDCGKRYCKKMSSCSEAYYKFKECKQTKLDQDRDGVPCENVCGRNISSLRLKLQRGL
ncbi:MAG: excalibur calcium-binding domain-containing protein [Thiolinea sp.]